MVKDTLPAGLTYISGSTVLYNNNLTSGKAVNDDIVSANGMNIGDYAGSTGWAEVVYKAKVNADVKCDGKLELVNSAIISTTDGNKKASVTLTVAGDKCEEKPEPEPDCTTNPELPECQEKPDCTTNPELPECQKEPTCETNPEMEGCQTPEEIVSTGPLEITLAVVIVLGIAGGCFYLYHTKKTLKHVEDKVSGKAADKKVEETKKDDTLSKS